MKHLIEQNKKYVKAVIRKFTGSFNEDIEQEVYLKTWQKLPEYKEEGKFKQWICMITANICKDYFRSKNYKSAVLESNDDTAIENIVSADNPEKVTDEKERQKVILKAVDSLSKEHRKVVVLFEFEGYSLEEISLRLKIPVGTVKSRLFNARKILKDKLNFLQGEN